MHDDTVIGLAFILPTLALIIWALLFRSTPRQSDWTAERHRKISHNGFKSRMGMK